MTIQDLQKHIGLFRPALVLESIVSRETRWKGERALTLLLSLSAAVTVFVHLGSAATAQFSDNAFPEIVLDGLLGITLVVLTLKLIAMAHDSFFYSYYFRGMNSILDRTDPDHKNQVVTFELASILFNSDSGDVTKDFIFSRYGFACLRRCGIEEDSLREFFNGRQSKITPDSVEVRSETGSYGIVEYIHTLLHADQEFASFIAVKQIQEKELVAAAEWTIRLERAMMRRRRFWSKDSLGRIPGLGKDWAYGGAYVLEKYSHDISSRQNFGSIGALSGYGSREVDEIEAILARQKESNALLIGEYTAGKLDILAQLARRIMEGKVLPPLEDKHMVLLDTELLIASKKDKPSFETEFIRLFHDAMHAGNVILVFENFSSFIASAQSIGSDIVSLMDPYLSSPAVQVVAMVDTDTFHQVIENNTVLMQRFEKVTVQATNEESTIAVLEDIVLQYEAKDHVFFTYQAVREIAEGADRYFSEGVMPDKAIDLLAEIVPKIVQSGRRTITKTDILELIKQKTGIAVGEVTGEEKDKLLKLEELLHARIIGQDEAVTAIAQSMRRARSGIGSESRPMGSFLFLGPTGVGKTETTKALAHTFFNDEKAVVRIDMSEYNTPDALDRLIGSFNFGKVGVLATKLREKPYGVLLLDEFEKSNKEVMDLFLQVLDEGFFSDMSGKRVNCRNLIIIATSNAGSDTIFKLVAEGKDLAGSKDAIIDEIIRKGTFRPEFLNRFDGVIIFHPLKESHLREVARLMLGRLKKRLAEKNMELVINDDLINYLMRFGVDPKFGGRPMNRAIQEKIEELIARSIIKGELKPGSKIEFNAQDLA